MRIRFVLAIVASLAPAAGAFAAGTGLVTDADRVPWARFQGRITTTYSAATPAWRSEFRPLDRTGLKVSGATVMGDLYVGQVPLGGKSQVGGFRATSGVVLGARSPVWGAPALASANLDPRFASVDASREPSTMPYLGIGYSSLALRAGWSFSADLGLVSLAPGNAVRFGRVFGGSQNLDDVIRDMRFAPVVQLGVSYSF